ncbi:MAG: hypothetical protein EBS06_07825 [Proteobacteria bacterium]|nr:hypothetical protein [Pseudomonadota bacterium]
MRHLTQKTKAISPILRSILNSSSAGAADIYQFKRFSGKVVREDNLLVSYDEVKKISEGESNNLILTLLRKIKTNPGIGLVNLKDPSVIQVGMEDIVLKPQDNLGQIVVVSPTQSELFLHYGKKGIAPSAKISPRDLLTNTLIIPPNSHGVIDIARHVPFLIKAKNPENSIALTLFPICEFPTHEENIKRYSFSTIVEMPQETAKIMAIRLQQAIFEDKKNEYFYEEITSKVYLPTKYNKSSGTLMNFELEDIERLIGKTTATHYHPGERSLFIFTTNKNAGVTLNFCGVEEIPDKRKDCEVKVTFPKNSVTVLNFPPYTHHKFNGEFTCLSIHPREGNNLIEAVQSGNLPKGFLESATIFSKSFSDEEDAWKLSLPNENEPTKTKDRTL